MRVSVHAPDLAPEMANRFAERIKATLGRYGSAIREVAVQLRDENGPRGGEDQSCVVQVALAGAPDVVVRQRGEQPLATLSSALKRVRRSIGERINARGRRHAKRPRSS